MTLLELARGPALQAATLIMVAGMVWRITGIALLRRRPHRASPRHSMIAQIGGGAATIMTRFIPRKTFWPRIAVSVVLSAVFHIGLAVILLGGAPHILIIRQITGLTWPDLPKGLIVVTSGLTLASLVALLVRRMRHPVLRLLSNTDDYLSWTLVFVPVASGMLLSGETIASYASLLTLHLLSVEALMIWLPFGKLMHTVFVFAGRGAMGVNFTRKGAAT